MNPSLFFANKTCYGVVGASADRSKFGSKVLRWYLDRSLNAVPVNPKAPSIENIACVSSIADLKEPSKTAISIITPPSVTLQVLKQAHAMGIKDLWLQPGCESSEVTELVQQWTNAGAGMNVIFGGPCILVIGDAALMESSKL
ncbi:CoA-binding protein [Chytriomyces cf. hyalinus JEL632]|nr:CoA-binding protein [Chytriomyces cf. hyalinus JEL632]